MRVRSSVPRADCMEYQYLDAMEHNSWVEKGYGGERFSSL